MSVKRFVLFACAARVAVLGFAGCSGGKQVVINVYNWGDYIDEGVIGEFEKSTGIKVNYETFATNEDMYVKVKQGGTRYDVLVPSDYMIARMIKEGLLERIDPAKIGTYGNIDRKFKELEFDPNNEYSVPYLWGTFGILYNKKKVSGPVDSWNALWDERYKKQILMMDSVRDSLAVAFLRLGLPINTTKSEDLAKAAGLLAAQKPLVLAYVGDNGKDMMLAGEAALAMAWSGDAVAVKAKNPDLEYVIPKEGTNLWVDAMVIPKNSEHKAEALKFIDFMNRPEIAKRNAEFIGYATPNSKAFDLLSEDVKNDPVAYPPIQTFTRMQVFVDVGEANAEYNRLWTEIKSR